MTLLTTILVLVYLTIGLAVFVSGCKIRMPKTVLEFTYGLTISLAVGPYLFVKWMQR